MDYSQFKDHCKKIFTKNTYLPQADDEIIEKLYLLTDHMLKVNQHMNLTAIKDEKAVILRHYADSLTVSQYLPQNVSIIDVGCGAGFPTLPLSIFRPDLIITALDSTAKRIDYVKNTAKLLNLSNVTAIAERAEVLANDQKYREKYDIATARAVASLPVLTELCLPFVKIGGKFIAMKAQKADEEVALSKNAIIKCGGELENNISQPLADLDENIENRNIIIIKKSQHTSKEYPRHFSKICKKPL